MKKKKKKGHTWVGIQSPPVLVEVAGWSSGNKNDQVWLYIPSRVKYFSTVVKYMSVKLSKGPFKFLWNKTIYLDARP